MADTGHFGPARLTVQNVWTTIRDIRAPRGTGPVNSARSGAVLNPNQEGKKFAITMNTSREQQQSRGGSFSSASSPVAAPAQSAPAVATDKRAGLRDLFSSYKITALQDVTIRACVNEKPEWVNLHAGEIRYGVKTVLGVHPNDAPEHRAIHAFGATFVATDTRGLPLPTDFYGVLRVEQEDREAA